MPPLVHLPVVLPGLRPVPLRRDHRHGAASLHLPGQPVRVERPVPDQSPERKILRKRRHPREVVRLPGKDHEADQIPERVHGRQDPARQAAPGAADPLAAGPPFAPAAFRCVWTIVPSTNTHSRSNSSDKALKARSKTPESAQRRNRLDTLFQLPKRSGRSRQGDPVRNRTGTASTKRRLSAAVPPGSDALPGSMVSIRAHMASVSTVLSAFIVLLANVHVACAAVPAVIGAEHGIKPNESQHNCQQALALGVVMALSFGAFMLWASPFYHIDTSARGQLVAYGKVIWLSLLLVPAYSTMMTALRSLGGEADAARASVLALILNMVLNPLLIFGLGSWPGLGIVGAAWATVLAQAVATVLAASSLARNRFGARVFSASNLGWCPHLYRDIAVIGLPLGGVMVLYNLEQAAVTAIDVSFGTAVSDGFGIGVRICGFLFMAIFGIAIGASVTVGLHLGAERADVVHRALPRFAGVGTAAIGAVVLPLAVLGEELLGLFTQDAATVAAGGTYLRFMAVALCLLCVHHVFNAAFEGAGRNIPVLLASSAMYLGVELPAVLALAFLGLLNPEALWATMIVTAAAGGLLSALLFRQGGWRAKPLSTKLQKGKTK